MRRIMKLRNCERVGRVASCKVGYDLFTLCFYLEFLPNETVTSAKASVSLVPVN